MKYSSMRRRFFIKTLATFLLLLYVPIVLMGTISAYMLSTYIKKVQTEDVQTLIRQISNKVDLIMDRFKPLILSANIDGQTSYISKKLLNSIQLNYTDLFLLNNVKDLLASNRNSAEYVQSIAIYYENDFSYYISDSGKHMLGPDTRYWYDAYLLNKDRTEPWTVMVQSERFDGREERIIALCYPLIQGQGLLVFNLIPEILENVITEGLEFGGHSLSVVSSDGELLMGEIPQSEDLSRKYYIQTLLSEDTGWFLTLYSPNMLVFRLYKNILALFLAGLVFCSVVGTISAVYLTRKKTRQMYSIIALIDSAEKDSFSVSSQRRYKKENTFEYIIDSLVETFLQQKYLKTQLEAKKYKTQNAQLLALQAQLNPHFLFNTLETVNWKVYQLSGRPNDATDMIENLSEILRYALCGDRKTVCLREEIYYVKCYLKIQKYRFREKAEGVFCIEPKCEDCLVPRMILQPLVENSIEHGLKRTMGTGTILISAVRSGDFLRIVVSDNGVGLKERELQALQEKLEKGKDSFSDTHIGLGNVNARLFLSYGTGVSVSSSPKGGVSVEIMIPWEVFDDAYGTDC